jgi:hypothetical protein
LIQTKSRISEKKPMNSWFFPQKVLTQPKNVVTIAGFASKKVKLSTQTKALRVVRSVDDGSKTDLGAVEKYGLAIKPV